MEKIRVLSMKTCYSIKKMNEQMKKNILLFRYENFMFSKMNALANFLPLPDERSSVTNDMEE